MGNDIINKNKMQYTRKKIIFKVTELENWGMVVLYTQTNTSIYIYQCHNAVKSPYCDALSLNGLRQGVWMTNRKLYIGVYIYFTPI